MVLVVFETFVWSLLKFEMTKCHCCDIETSYQNWNKFPKLFMSWNKLPKTFMPVTNRVHVKLEFSKVAHFTIDFLTTVNVCITNIIVCYSTMPVCKHLVHPRSSTFLFQIYPFQIFSSQNTIIINYFRIITYLFILTIFLWLHGRKIVLIFLEVST